MSTSSLQLRLKHKLGDVIAERYEIVEEIKSGGMGTVYKVKDKSLSLYYACKEMDILDKREEFVKKFKREAVNLQRLHNPHIPKAFYVEDKVVWLVCPVCGDSFYGVALSPCHKHKPMVVKKRYYLMMEFIEGENLEEKIEKEGKPLREKDIVRWTLEVCEALKEIHSMGMVHRDVKPDNIMIDRKNRPYLLDMGLVKEIVIGSGYETIKITQTANMGTPGYAPIEQYRYGNSESRSDIYALGMTMYRLLANKDPRDPTELMEMDQRNPRYFNSNISVNTEQVISKATKENKEDRFVDIKKFEAALKHRATIEKEVEGKTASEWFDLGRKAKKPAKQVEYYSKSLKIDPEYTWAWNNKGVALQDLGRDEEAIGCYDKALEIDPKNVKAWYNKGIVLDDLIRYEEAIGCYDKALEIDPEYTNAWYNKGIVLQDLGRYEEAIGCYDKALEIDPNDASAWFNKGLALGDLEKYEEAINCYDKGLEIDPNDVGAWNNKGFILGLLGRYEEAGECYDKALKIDPFDEFVRSIRKHIKRLKGHSSSVKSVAFSPDGKLLASGSSDKTVKFWQVKPGRCIKTLRAHSKGVNCVAFSPDGSSLASGGYEKK